MKPLKVLLYLFTSASNSFSIVDVVTHPRMVERFQFYLLFRIQFRIFKLLPVLLLIKYLLLPLLFVLMKTVLTRIRLQLSHVFETIVLTCVTLKSENWTSRIYIYVNLYINAFRFTFTVRTECMPPPLASTRV
jgi:hypothetical protein